MKESATYQAILEEGRSKGAVDEARKVLRRQGKRILGEPNADTVLAIEAMDLSRLEELLDRVFTATDWASLLGRSTTSRRRGKRRST